MFTHRQNTRMNTVLLYERMHNYSVAWAVVVIVVGTLPQPHHQTTLYTYKGAHILALVPYV